MSGSPKSFFSQPVCSAEKGGGVNVEQKQIIEDRIGNGRLWMEYLRLLVILIFEWWLIRKEVTDDSFASGVLKAETMQQHI